MNRSKFLFATLVIAVVTLGFYSCAKDASQTTKSFSEIKSETRTLIEPIGLVFNYAYSNYTMIQLCACNCSAANIAQNVLNSQFSSIPMYSSLSPLNYNCTELFKRLSVTCNKSENEKIFLVDSLISFSYTQNFITLTEKDILKDLIINIHKNPKSIPFESYYTTLNNITNNSSTTNLALTTNILMNTENAIKYFSGVVPPTGVTEPQFLINKAMGGLASGFLGWCWDIYDNGGGGGPNAPRNFARNFVGGALTSL